MARPRGKSWGEIRRATTRGISDGLNDTVSVIIGKGTDRLADEGKVDTGVLLDSAETVGKVERAQGKKSNNNRPHGRFAASPDLLEAIAMWSVEYAKYVHYGAGPAIGNPPFWPPEEPIRKWVERNLRIDPSGGGRKTVLKPQFRKGTKTPTQQEIDRVTYLVRKKIHDKGIEPTPFATAGREDAIRRGPFLIRDAINDEMDRL